MLSKLGYSSMDAFVDEAVPPKIRIPTDAICDKAIGPLSEAELLRRAKHLGEENKPLKSYIGMGYHNAVVPTVILRNVSFSVDRDVITISSRYAGHGESRMVYPVYPVSS